MWILDFLFGKKPKINFSKQGQTYHDHSEEKWRLWKDRFEKNPEFNWKNHIGRRQPKR